MQAKILVSGASGNVGSEVVRELLKLNAPVRAVYSDPTRLLHHDTEDSPDGCEVVGLRFGEPGSYPAAFTGIEQVFLMRPPPISDVKKFIFPAIDAARLAGVRHFVFLSLIGIENNQRVPHYAIEQYLLQSGMETTFLRCSFFMQNLNTTHRKEIRERSEIYIPAGQARTSFIDARDIGAVAALALTRPGHAGQAYNLTGGEALDYTQVAQIFTRVLGRPVLYRDPPLLAYFWRQVTAGVELPFALISTWLYWNTRNGMAERVTPEVERLLGRRPISLEQYVQDYKDSWM
jgi:uncharacterized protein YbjT (DUF2867 family)